MSTTIIEIKDLTEAKVGGSGVFDVMMQATKAHLDEEFKKNRITGPEYSTVYLGAIQQVMQASLEFLTQKHRIGLEADLLAQQILLTEAQVAKALVDVELARVQKDIALAELEIAQLNATKIPAEIAQLTAQTALIGSQKLQVEAETLNVPKQGALIDSQKAVQDQQKINLTSENLRIEAQTDQINQEVINLITQETVLKAQKCKLDAEFDLTVGQTAKTSSETTLLNQKTATEKAQVDGTGIATTSVIGKQIALYDAQAAGIQRDAEQKAAKILVDSWGVQRTTDEGIAPPSGLANNNIDRAVSKLLAGVSA